MPLSDDSIEKWEYKEHTRVKHEILSKYLSGWIRILGKWHKVCYFDCFAGKGRYADGELGSPLIALDVASRLKKTLPHIREIVCVFIEKNPNNYENLKEIIDVEIRDHPEKYDGIKIIPPINDEFANFTSEISDQLAPSFFFIDPFGFGGVPFQNIKNILSIPRTEVFINFMVRDVNRFLESSKHRISIDELFGIDNVLNVLSEKYPNLPKEPALLKLYRMQLHEVAKVKYTLPFKVNADERLQTTFYLIHATNHPMGCELMKEIMYKLGTEGRFGYFGPAEGQMTLTQYDSLLKLKDFLIKKFAGRRLTYQNVRYETLMDTEFIKKHYRQALLELENESKISIKGKGPKGGFPDEAQVIFSS